ncbi:MAG: TlpA family protein disulfide reductase, partial [Arenimonas sp.]
MIRSLSLFLMLISTSAFADLSEGQPAPNLLGKDVKGNPVTVDAFRGKVLVVTFWASWCGPCRKELPALNALQNAVGTELIQVVA